MNQYLKTYTNIKIIETILQQTNVLTTHICFEEVK